MPYDEIFTEATKESPRLRTSRPFVQVLRELGKQGDPIPTGFEPLDRQLRGGGLRAGRVLLIGGPPEAGKTTLLIQMMRILSNDYPVYCLFRDEGDDQAAVRLGQQLGKSRELLEKGDEATHMELEERMALAGAEIEFGDPDARGASLELALEDMNLKCPPRVEGGPRVLVLDSVQTIPARKDANAEDERKQTVELMDAMRVASRSHNLIVLASSQVARAFYQSKNPAERRNASAAFLGSSRIEFGADVALVIYPSNEEGISKVEITKNRLRPPTGMKPFAVKVDYARSIVVEVEAGAEPTDEDEQKHLATAKQAIRDALKNHRPGIKGTSLFEIVGGRRATYLRARAELISEKTIFVDPDGRWPVYKLTLDAEYA